MLCLLYTCSINFDTKAIQRQQSDGNEHARAGAGENYHVHVKDGAGREARISTETWKPLTPEDQRIYDEARQCKIHVKN